MRSRTFSMWALCLSVLCVMPAGGAAAKSQPPVGKYTVKLHAAVASSAPINWDNRDGHLDSGCCFSASGKLEANWSSDVKAVLTFNRHGQLSKYRDFNAIFFEPGLAAPYESAGRVKGDWAGVDDTLGPASGSDPPHNYSCRYSLDASSIPGATVAWRLFTDPAHKANVLVSFVAGVGYNGQPSGQEQHPACTGYKGEGGYPGDNPLGSDAFLPRGKAFSVSVPAVQLVKHSSRSIGPRDVDCDNCAGPSIGSKVHSVGAFDSTGKKKKK